MNGILKKYFMKTLTQVFAPIFLTLITITSIIFLVKIASLTSIIQMDFFELLELYLYHLPLILFYTLPISIFISLALTLSKLSSEYELIVITSFGLDPKKIINLVLPFLSIFTVLMLVITLALIPKANFLKERFIVDKKTEAQFNIKASEYGQEFGNWLIYVNEENNGIYKDIVLFQQKQDEDIFIVSKFAKLDNLGSSLNLTLQDGKVISVKDSVNQVNFKKMVLNNEIKFTNNISTFRDLVEYWKNQQQKFTFYFLGSLLPIISIFFIVYIGYYNPRYNKNYTTVLGIILTVIYVLIIHRLSKEIGIVILYYIPIIWFILGFIAYRYKIRPYY